MGLRNLSNLQQRVIAALVAIPFLLFCILYNDYTFLVLFLVIGIFAQLEFYKLVGSISDNRLGGWHSYRASKAALNMIAKGVALELARTRPQAICVTLHPGTVETGLSAPFRSSSDAGVISAPQSAAALLGVLQKLTPAESGKCFGWDGVEIPA